MNNNDLEFQNNDNIYRANTNLNTALENPNVDIDNAMDINIQNNLNSTSFESNLINNSVNNVDVSVDNNYNTSVSMVSNITGVNLNQNVFINNSSNNFLDNNLTMKNEVSVNQNNTNVDDIHMDSDINNKVSYTPVLKSKKKPSSGFGVTKEIKTLFVIIIVLMLVMWFIPYVYDFFKKLSLDIVSR